MAPSEPKYNEAKVSTTPAIDHSITAKAAVKAVKAGRAKDVDIAAQVIAEHADIAEGAAESRTAKED